MEWKLSLGWALCSWSLGVRNDLGDYVGVAGDSKVEAPIVIDACLPKVMGLGVLLGMQRRVPQIAGKEVDLFDEGLLHHGQSTGKRGDSALGIRADPELP